MRTVLLLSGDEDLHASVRNALDTYALLVAKDDDEGLALLASSEVDVLLRDGAAMQLSWAAFLSQVKAVAPYTPVVALGGATTLGLQPDLSLPRFPREADLRYAIRQIDDQRLRRELDAVRARPSAPSTITSPAADAPSLPRGVIEFTRAFASGHDRARVLQTFIDAVADLLRPTRTALLLPDPITGDYVVAAHRGLAAPLAARVRVSAGSPLVRWLAAEGRPARMQDLERDQVRDLVLVQGVVAVPLLAQAELQGILAIGQPVMGGHYSRADTETLFELGSHLGAAIRDIALHDAEARARERLEEILRSMPAAIVTVESDGRVALVNQRAAAVLGLAADVVGQDARALPSPLGDLLIEAARAEEPLPRREVQLRPNGVWLAVSAYAVRAAGGAPIGVAIVEDLTATRELAAQRSRAEQLQLLTSLMATIADEIRNPLQSIRIFMEILQDNYDDKDFRARFTTVVTQDVAKLLRVFETMGGLIGHEPVSTEPVEPASLFRDLDASYEGMDGLRLDVADAGTAPVIQADPKQLRKAIVYLIEYLAHKAPRDAALQTVTVGMRRPRSATPGEAVIAISAAADVRPEDVATIFDLIALVPRGLKQVGPAVSARLIASMGGRLDYQYRPDQFAFFITLPTAL